MNLRRIASHRTGSCACAGLLLGLGGCAGSMVQHRIDELRSTLEDAERRGAARCAPVELALSSVHLEFARLELREGDEQRAERHLIVAEPNGKAALRRTKEGDCHPSAASVAANTPSAGGVRQPQPVPRSTASRPQRVADAQGLPH
jgi:OmpA-OmpF porin, OOP family